MIRSLLFTFSFFCWSLLSAQITGPEQDCANAILVCQETYVQNQYYQGNGNDVDIARNSVCFTAFAEEFSVWYRVEIQSNGELSFDLAALAGDDYDFAVYNVTGLSCEDIYDGTGLVRCNFSLNSTSDTTGLRPGYIDTTSDALGNPYLKPLDVLAGESYLILIGYFNFDVQQFPSGGYSLDFTQSTADIIDVTPAQFDQVEFIEACNTPDSIRVVLDSRVLCSSVAADASDFDISGPANLNLQSAIPVNCNERGETTEIILIPASGSISPGAYDLSLQQGSDGNTLLDGCGNESLPQTLSFQIDVLDAIIDYTISSSCNADTFYFSFDGLSSPLSYQWVLNGDTITQPDFTYVFPDIGNFDVELTTFSQNCSAQDFETVSPANIHRAGFSATERACVGTEVMFTDETRGNPDAWEWRFEPGGTSNLQNPDYTFNQSGNFNVRLIAIDNTTNCRDTFFQTIEIVDEPVLDFDTPDEICQNESFDIEYTGTGIQQNIEWIIGGDTIQEEAPTLNIAEIGETNIQLIFTDSICGVFTLEKNISINEVPYFDLGNDTLICPLDNIRLNAFSRADRIRWSTGETSEEIVVDTFNLFVSARAQLGTCSYRDTIYIGTKEEDCFKIIMPSAFSPNGDGLNDFYKVLSKKLESFTLRIYNRWGELIFEEENNRFGGWDGTYKGQGVDVGVYTYYVKGKTLLGDKIDQTGILTLIR